MSSSFPIPDWGDKAFTYPGIKINGETTVSKKPKNKKRKHDGDRTLERGQPGDSEVPQQTFKKKKTIKTDSAPEKKNIEDTQGLTASTTKKIKKKDKGKNKTTELFSHQENTQTSVSELKTEGDSKTSPRKKKKRKNNNKYKELNIRQKEERMAQAVPAGDKNEYAQQGSTKTTKSREVFHPTLEEEAQSSQAEESKKKKKKKDKSKLLSSTDSQKSNEVFQATLKGEAQSSQAEDSKKKKKKKDKSKLLDSTDSQNNSTGTPYDHAIQDVKIVNGQDSKMFGAGKKKKKKKSISENHDTIQSNSSETLACLESNSHDNVGANKKKKRKRSINENNDTIQSSADETQVCLESNGHQNACSEEKNKVKNKNKVKGYKNEEGNCAESNGIGSPMPMYKFEEVRTEDGTKKKKKEKVEDNGNVLRAKDTASNSKKAKLEKQQHGGKHSRKVKESNEEELMFDSDEECSAEFTKDLGALLTCLNFDNFKTPSSGKDMNDDDDVEANNRQEVSKTINNTSSTKTGSEGEGNRKKKRKKEENAKRSHVKDNGEEVSKARNDESLTKWSSEEGKRKKKKKKKENTETSHAKSNGEQNSNARPAPTTPVKKGAKFDRERVAMLLEKAASIQREKPSPPATSADTLKQKMEGRLMAARFRMVNQDLYTKSSTEARQLFQRDPTAFDVYHQGYQAQVCQWPVNPLDLIIKWLTKKPKEWVVADMGCGEATLAQQVPQSRVHSLDLVAANSRVTACDMAHTPLPSASVDVVVFCLSLMGTNLKDFIVEANRVLRDGGILKIAEVESRFDDVKEFEKHLAKYGFQCTKTDVSQKYFFLLEFKKKHKLKKTANFPDISLKPCLYKKR